jgi:hypothetical protein
MSFGASKLIVKTERPKFIFPWTHHLALLMNYSAALFARLLLQLPDLFLSMPVLHEIING